MFKSLTFRIVAITVIGIYMLFRGFETLIQEMEGTQIPLNVAVSIPATLFVISVIWTTIKIKYSEKHLTTVLERYFRWLFTIYFVMVMLLLVLHYPYSRLLLYFTAAFLFISTAVLQHRSLKNVPPPFNNFG